MNTWLVLAILLVFGIVIGNIMLLKHSAKLTPMKKAQSKVNPQPETAREKSDAHKNDKD